MNEQTITDKLNWIVSRLEYATDEALTIKGPEAVSVETLRAFPGTHTLEDLQVLEVNDRLEMLTKNVRFVVEELRGLGWTL